jgi:hypothetical protein
MNKLFLAVAMVFCFDAYALVDSDATAQTVELYQRLVDTAGKKILIGEMMFYNPYHPEYGTPVYEITGKWPVVLALDYDWSNCTNRGSLYPLAPTGDYDQTAIYTQLAKQHIQRGGILTVSWHMWNWDTGDQASSNTGDPVTNILPGGSSRATYLAALDRFAGWANSFTDYDGNLIPFVFRPFHEDDGGWFWWGIDTCTDAQYVALWRDLVTYLRDTKGVHNMLYVYGPEAYAADTYTGARYPGDAYIDIIGIDVYSTRDDFTEPQWMPGNSNGPSALTRWHRAAQASADKGKPWVICEGVRDQHDTAYRADYWTWLFDQWLADEHLRTMSYVVFWESSYWGPIVGRGDATSYNALTGYENIGWLENDRARLKNCVINE